MYKQILTPVNSVKLLAHAMFIAMFLSSAAGAAEDPIAAFVKNYGAYVVTAQHPDEIAARIASFDPQYRAALLAQVPTHAQQAVRAQLPAFTSEPPWYATYPKTLKDIGVDKNFMMNASPAAVAQVFKGQQITPPGSYEAWRDLHRAYGQLPLDRQVAILREREKLWGSRFDPASIAYHHWYHPWHQDEGFYPKMSDRNNQDPRTFALIAQLPPDKQAKAMRQLKIFKAIRDIKAAPEKDRMTVLKSLQEPLRSEVIAALREFSIFIPKVFHPWNDANRKKIIESCLSNRQAWDAYQNLAIESPLSFEEYVREQRLAATQNGPIPVAGANPNGKSETTRPNQAISKPLQETGKQSTSDPTNTPASPTSKGPVAKSTANTPDDQLSAMQKQISQRSGRPAAADQIHNELNKPPTKYEQQQFAKWGVSPDALANDPRFVAWREHKVGNLMFQQFGGPRINYIKELRGFGPGTSP